jgi:hypothetical protein
LVPYQPKKEAQSRAANAAQKQAAGKANNLRNRPAKGKAVLSYFCHTAVTRAWHKNTRRTLK